MATPCTKSLGCVGGSIIRSEEVRGANLDVRQRFFVGSGRPVGVDLERRIPRYHETSRDLERVEESGAAVLEPRIGRRKSQRSIMDEISNRPNCPDLAQISNWHQVRSQFLKDIRYSAFERSRRGTSESPLAQAEVSERYGTRRSLCTGSREHRRPVSACRQYLIAGDRCRRSLSDATHGRGTRP